MCKNGVTGVVGLHECSHEFKARLDGALGSLGCYEMWRLVALPVVGAS